MICCLQKSALGQRAYPSSPGHALPVECYSITELHVHALPLPSQALGTGHYLSPGGGVGGFWAKHDEI